MTKDGIPQLSSNSYWRGDHTSSKQMTMLFTENASTFKTLYTREENRASRTV